MLMAQGEIQYHECSLVYELSHKEALRVDIILIVSLNHELCLLLFYDFNCTPVSTPVTLFFPSQSKDVLTAKKLN